MRTIPAGEFKVRCGLSLEPRLLPAPASRAVRAAGEAGGLAIARHPR